MTAELARLRAENETLREELRQVRAALAERCARLPLDLNLTRQQRVILGALLDRDAMSAESLRILMGAETVEAPRIQIHHLRKRLPAGMAVRVRRGIGYYLDGETKERLRG